MTYYILGFLLAIGIFVVGFFVGGKWKARTMARATAAAGTIKDTIGKI